MNEFFGSHGGILCFGGEDWWYHNQAHFDMQLMRCLARKLPVLYVNSVGFRMPSLKDRTQFRQRIGRKLRSVTSPLQSPFPNFYVASPFSVPLWHRRWITKLNVRSLVAQIRMACRHVQFCHPIVWVACPTAFEVVQCVRGNSFLVYQRTDKYEEYSEQSREYILAADRWLTEHADLTVYASRALYEEEQHRNRTSLLVSHGVEVDRFDPAKLRLAGIPADLACIKGPIVGFFGDIEDSLVDMQLVATAARALPDVAFVLIGRFMADPEPIKGLPNVHCLGKKRYEDIPYYGIRFDVAIMPWQRNPWIEHCNPIKLKEYLALGLPVVSTAFPEVLQYENVVYIAQTLDDFVCGIKEALAGRAPGTVESRRAYVAGNTWEKAAMIVAENIRTLTDQRSYGDRVAAGE